MLILITLYSEEGESDWRNQFSLRLKTLVDKKRVIQTRTVTNSKAPANFVALFEGFQQFDGDLNKLQVGLLVVKPFAQVCIC